MSWSPSWTSASTQLNGLSLSGKIAECGEAVRTIASSSCSTEAIVELYDAVRQIQLAIWPMLAVIPDVSARSGTPPPSRLASSSTMLSPMAKLKQPPRFTR